MLFRNKILQNCPRIFKEKSTLPNSTIKHIIECSEVHFYLEDAPCIAGGQWWGQKRKETSQQTVATPCVLLWKLAQHVPTLSYTNVHCTLKDICLCLYHIQLRKELKPMNLAKRVIFCDWFLKLTHCGTSVLDNIVFTDKASVHESGHINLQIYLIWTDWNFHEYTEFKFQRDRHFVYHFMVTGHWINLFFVMQVTIEWYQNIIKQFISLLELSECCTWFQQDGAKADTVASTKEFLADFFNYQNDFMGFMVSHKCIR